MKRWIAAGMAALAAASMTSGLSTASAEEVTVSLSNPGGSRTVYVEDLLGQELSTLNFGTSRSQPFRVRVVDDTMDRSGFEVVTTMSNLYLEDGATFDWDEIVPSDKLGVAYPPNPLNLLSPEAVIEPIYDFTETVSGALCTTITTLGGSCTVVMSGVDGLRQTVDLAVDLGDLNSLPLIPQEGETGLFDDADFAGIAADDPSKPGTFVPTTRRVISGVVSNAVETLDSVTAALELVIAGLPASSLVDSATLAGALRNSLGGTVYDALLPAQVSSILAALEVAVRDVTAADIVGQSGTYLSYPKLDVELPADQTPGSYKGTLVVTAVQL